jgi:hypothetical protein
MDNLRHFTTKLFLQVTYHCQGSKGLEMETIRTVVLVMQTSECRIHWKGLENVSLGTPVNRLENNSNFKLRSSRIKNPRIRDPCPETSVRKYHYSLPNISEVRSSHLLRDGSLKSPNIIQVFRDMIMKVRDR